MALRPPSSTPRLDLGPRDSPPLSPNSEVPSSALFRSIHPLQFVELAIQLPSSYEIQRLYH
jgi:hypothetical protein